MAEIVLTSQQRLIAADWVLRDTRVRLCIRHDREALGVMAQEVATYCSSSEGFTQRLMIDRDAAEREVVAHLKEKKEVVGFIPMIIFAIIIKVIVAILIDFWLLNYVTVTTQSNTN